MRRIGVDYQNKNIYKTKQSNFGKWVPFISIGLVIVQTAVILLVVSLENGSVWNKTSHKRGTTSSGDSVPSSPDNKRTYRNYRSFEFGTKKFKCSERDFEYIDSNLIENQIGEIDIKSTNEKVNTKHIRIFAIKKIDSNLGIAVKFEEETGCFLYSTCSLDSGISINDLLNDFNFEENVFYSSLSYVTRMNCRMVQQKLYQ